MIIFTHIAKSAGSSIKQGIRDNFADIYFGNDIRKYVQNPNIYERMLYGIPVEHCPGIISNHLPYGIHKLFNTEFSYFTFLRHPIPRSVSCFYHTRLNPVARKQKRGILNALKWCLKENTNCNVMTRQLSGIDNLEKLILPDVTKEEGGLYYVGTRSAGYSDEEMQKMLEQAKFNLKNCYDFVGFQENSFNDMDRLCKHYGWKSTWPSKFLKSRTKSHPDWKTKAVIDVINKMNKYDLQLYDYAREEYDGKN